MKKFTKILSLLLCLAMVFSFAACTGKTDDSATTTEETVPADTTTINITTLKGPTGMGMAKLISDKNAQYNISIATAATDSAPHNQGRSGYRRLPAEPRRRDIQKDRRKS